MSGQYQPRDRYFHKAKEQGYRARSVFKLEEIQDRFHLIRPGDKVLDLGAAPGSFMQFILEVIGERGLIIGVDLQPIKSFSDARAKTYVGDIFDEKIYEQIAKDTGRTVFDVVTSDLAPSTSGIKFVDAGRSFDLNSRAIEVARQHLKPNGHLLLKAFPGEDHSKLIAEAKTLFWQVKVAKPAAVRETSREEYIVCLGKKPN